MPGSALHRAAKWLSSVQGAEGCWPDFLVSSTLEGRHWTTGYVTALLAPLAGRSQGPLRGAVTRARRYLHAARRPGGGWGFQRDAPVDADSTAWCMAALLSGDPQAVEGLAEDRAELLRHHRREQGFGTYRAGNIDRYPDDSGCYAALPCVTAAAGRVLAELGRPEDRQLLEQLERWLYAVQDDDGVWSSFWWEGPFYPTSVVVSFLVARAARVEPLARVRDRLAELQAADGSWRGPAPDAFATALALATLCDLGAAPDDPAVRRGAGWLLASQQADGSWEAGPILLVPEPDATWPLAADAPLVRIPGWRRTFVTATVMATLARLVEADAPAWESGDGRLEGLRTPPLDLEDPKLEDEAVAVERAFDRQVRGWPLRLREMAMSTAEWRRRGRGLGLYLPFWLDQALGGGRFREAARVMALANRFGQFYCLHEDAVLDSDRYRDFALALPLSALHQAFLRGYQKLFSSDHPFWRDFERYWSEYLEAVAHDRERRRSGPSAFRQEDFAWMSRKTAPLKICGAAMTWLAGNEARANGLERCERLIDMLQAGYQLLDDLCDVQEDLAQSHWSWPLTLVYERLGRRPAADEAELMLWPGGLAVPVLDRALASLAEASEIAGDLGLASLAGWVERLQSWGTRHRDAAALPVARHLFRSGTGAGSLIYNASSGLLFEVEPALAAALSRRFQPWSERGEATDGASGNAVLNELSAAGILDAAPVQDGPEEGSGRILYVGARPGASHRCASCFGSAGTQAATPAPSAAAVGQALAALADRPGAGGLDVVFLEPGTTTPWSDLLAVAERARGVFGARVHLVADPGRDELGPIAAGEFEGHVCLSRHGVEDLDGVERFLEDVRDGLGARAGEAPSLHLGLSGYRGDLCAPLERLLESTPGLFALRSARSQPGSERPDAAASTADLRRAAEWLSDRLDEGRTVPFVDWVEPVIRVQRRTRRLRHCGAGIHSLAVTSDGELVPCFRAADLPALVCRRADGAPRRGALRPYRDASVEEIEPCRSCWARHLCGGACRDDNLRAAGDLRRPEATRCAVIRVQADLTLWLAARHGPTLERLGRTADWNDRLAAFQC